MCLHENDLETVEYVKVNQGLLMGHWNSLYLIGVGEDGVGRIGGRLVAKRSKAEM